MLILKPTHDRYVFHYLNSSSYSCYARNYSIAKRNGARGIYLWATGQGVWGLVREAIKGELICYGKKKLGVVCLSITGWTLGPIVPLVTNSSKIIGIVGRVHAATSFAAECLEDGGNLMFLPIDVALFGQPIQIGDTNRFNVMRNFTDFLDLD